MTTTSGTEAVPSADDSVSRPRTLGTLLRLHPYVKGSYTRLTLGIVDAIIGALVALAIPVVLSWIVDGPLTTNDSAQIFPAVGLIAALGVLEALLIALRRWLVLKPGTHVDGAMRKAIHNHLQQLPLAFHDKWQSGQLLSRAMSDISTVRRWISFGFVMLTVNVITIVAGFAMLFFWNPLMGAVFTACSLPMLFFGVRFELRYFTLSRSAQDQAGDVATNVEESVHGIRVLKAFGRSTFALDGFSARAKRLRVTETSKGVVIGNFTLGLTVLEALAYAFSLIAGIYLVSTGNITVGVLFAFFTTAAVLRWPLDSIGFLLQLTIDARTALDRFFEVIDEPVGVEESTHPIDLPAASGSLVFEDVSFRFADALEGTRPLLHNLSLEVRPGETMAVVGLTGSGKTTLTGLTTRLYDVTAGRILVDGVDIRDARLADLRSRVAMAFEDATLFSMSVRENVLLGRPDLVFPEGEAEQVAADHLVTQAINIAQADFVYSLPDGLETKIGEEGLSLSGGQRQRLALARAIVTEPAVLVLDDPLSALDVTTEQQVEAALRRVLATTTALIVAHRPSTVMLADRVAVLHEGRIADVGTHTELLARSALYRHIISSESDEPHVIPDVTAENETVIAAGTEALGEVDGSDGIRGVQP
ncbi:MAG: ABC transporter ATP-binding protein/permease [Aurantimicrobium sp.]|nr:ABC transporter ATP-binding protein/permease [Aurantimicrobium sp.]